MNGSLARPRVLGRCRLGLLSTRIRQGARGAEALLARTPWCRCSVRCNKCASNRVHSRGHSQRAQGQHAQQGGDVKAIHPHATQAQGEDQVTVQADELAASSGVHCGPSCRTLAL